MLRFTSLPIVEVEFRFLRVLAAIECCSTPYLLRFYIVIHRHSTPQTVRREVFRYLNDTVLSCDVCKRVGMCILPHVFWFCGPLYDSVDVATLVFNLVNPTLFVLRFLSNTTSASVSEILRACFPQLPVSPNYHEYPPTESAVVTSNV